MAAPFLLQLRGCVMAATVADIVRVMERLAPPGLAEDWDNVGLQVGRMDWPVNTVWVALDPSPDVVQAACLKGVDLLMTHHPMFFKPLRYIDFNKPSGFLIQQAVQHQLSIYAAHTNFDSAQDGLNDILAGCIGLINLKPLVRAHTETQHLCQPISDDLQPNDSLEGSQGLGRIGEFDEPTDLKSLALKIKKKLSLASVKLCGDPGLIVRKAAICTGSGSGLLMDFISSDAQAYISGDMRYHDAKDVQAVNRGLIDIGHFASEHIMVGVVAERLSAAMAKAGLKVDIKPYGVDFRFGEPFKGDFAICGCCIKRGKHY